MTSVFETYEKSNTVDKSYFTIHVFECRYGGDIVAIALMGDASHLAAENIAEEDFWITVCNSAAWFPIGVSDTHFSALDKLRKKMETIEYSKEWLVRLWDATVALKNYEGCDFQLPE